MATGGAEGRGEGRAAARDATRAFRFVSCTIALLSMDATMAANLLSPMVDPAIPRKVSEWAVSTPSWSSSQPSPPLSPSLLFRNSASLLCTDSSSETASDIWPKSSPRPDSGREEEV